MRYKKPSIQDVIYIAIVIVVFAVGILICFKIMDSINTKFSESESVQKSDADGKARAAMNEINEMYPNVIDNSFLLLIVLLCIFVLAMATMVRIHPIFFVFFIIILIITIFLAGVFSNIYIEIANEPEMASLADELRFTTHLMKLLPIIIGVVGFLVALVLYKSWQVSQQ